MMLELTGRTALVTGAARRLGKVIALGLAEQGANVVIHYGKSDDEAKKLQKEITALEVKSWALSANFSDPQSLQTLIEKADEISGGVNILVNNASIFNVSEATKADLKEFEINMLVNAWTPFMLSRYFAEKTERGSIINILDTRIRGHDFSHFAYYLSKKMLETLTESMALKLAPRITVNGVAPGLILPPEGKDQTYLEQRKDTVPLKKYGSVEDIAEAVIFLLRSDFVTGQVVYVDGGKHLIQTIEGL